MIHYKNIQSEKTERVNVGNEETGNHRRLAGLTVRRNFSIFFIKLVSICIIGLITILVCASFRANDYVLINTIKASVSFMTSDNLGDLYLVVNNELRKYDSDGILQKTYSDKAHGNIAFVDVSDPLSILIYYKDFRQILFLDNMLSVKVSPVLLDNLGMLQPILVCNSYESGFWVYDQQESQLVRFDKNLSKSNQSGNIVQLTGMEIKPNYLIEISGKVYLNDPDNGILVFDKYGTYSKTLPFKKLSSLQVSDDDVIFFKDSLLTQYNMKTFEQKSINLPAKSTITARYEKGRLFAQDSAYVKIYSVK